MSTKETSVTNSYRAMKRYQVLNILPILGVLLAILCLNSQSIGPEVEAFLLWSGDLISSPFPLPDGSAALSLLTNISVLFIAGWPLSLLLEKYTTERAIIQHEQEWKNVKAIWKTRLLETIDQLLCALLRSSSLHSNGYYFKFVKYWQRTEFDFREKVDLLKLTSEIENEFNDLVKFEKYAVGEGQKRTEQIIRITDDTQSAFENTLKTIAPLKDKQLSESITEMIEAIRSFKQHKLTWSRAKEDTSGYCRNLSVLLQAGIGFWKSIVNNEEMLTDIGYTNMLTRELDELFKGKQR